MKIAITGGIGSGKSYVCRELERHGIMVYDCDAGAKRLMRSDAALQEQLIQLVGNDVYQDGVLQKPVLAKFLLSSEANKQAVNDVVHPAVARDFEQSDCDWLESAILFEWIPSSHPFRFCGLCHSSGLRSFGSYHAARPYLS